MRFKNKVALITAGANGIGRATAKIMVSEGATVIVADNNQGHLDEAVPPGDDFMTDQSVETAERVSGDRPRVGRSLDRHWSAACHRGHRRAMTVGGERQTHR